MTECSAIPGAEADLPRGARNSRRIWGKRAIIGASCLTTVIVLTVVWMRNTGPESHYRRGRAALIAVDRDAVLREAETLIRFPGYERHGWLLKGLLLTQAGKLDEAIVYLGKAAEQESLTVEANTAAAQCLYTSGLYLQAIEAAQRALRSDPNCLDARRWLAAAYYDLGAVANAVEELRRISAEAPADPKPDRLLGLIAKDGEHYVEAVQHYSEALRRDAGGRDLDEIRAELADCQIKLGLFQDALRTLQAADASATVLTLMAECQSGLGNFADARDRLTEALRLDPRHFPAKLARGKLLLDQGASGDAARILAEAVQLEPRNSQGQFQLAQALRQTGRPEEADDALRRMREIQELEREFTDLHETAALRPNDAEIRYRIGELARELGKPRLARIWFQAALALDPKLTKARSAIRQLDHPSSLPDQS